MTDFTAFEQRRYQRHLQLSNFGEHAQSQLKKSRVLVVGVGGLGCPAALYLAGAGIGHITLVDGDTIELSNLGRQILYTEADINNNKASTAAKRLREQNSTIAIEAIERPFTIDNGNKLVESHDLVIDCTDNFPTRYLINDLCHNHNTPWIYGSITEYSGQMALFDGKGPCFRCIYPQAPNNPQDCNSVGVLNVLPGVIATLQVNEALKYLARLPSTVVNKLMLLESKNINIQAIEINKREKCLCHHTIQLREKNYQISCASDTSEKTVSKADMQAFLQHHNAQLVDVRSPKEHRNFNIGGINIPLTEESFVQQFQSQHTYLLYCQSGQRSSNALKLLQDNGILNVYSLEGGVN